MKNLETSVVHAVDRFPELAEQLVIVLARVDKVVGGLEAQNIPAHVATTLSSLDQVLKDVHAADPGKLSRQAQENLKNLNDVLARLGGDKGLAASARRTSDAMGSMAQNANHVGPALEETMRDVQSAAQSIQRLADSLGLDPDMLIKGRAKRGVK